MAKVTDKECMDWLDEQWSGFEYVEVGITGVLGLRIRRKELGDKRTARQLIGEAIEAEKDEEGKLLPASILDD